MEFDFPDLKGLTTLQHIKAEFPSLPVIMLTEQHSESLAIWALRTRVWDYIIQPVDLEYLCNSVERLFVRMEEHPERSPRSNFMPRPPIPIDVRFRNPAVPKLLTGPAMGYVHTRFQEKISSQQVAELCGLDYFQFSRAFKREHGITFQKFLVQYRINKAMELLRHPYASITDVAFSVGFNDPSHFSRTFQEHAGVSPSKFRNVALKYSSSLAGQTSTE